MIEVKELYRNIDPVIFSELIRGKFLLGFPQNYESLRHPIVIVTVVQNQTLH